ncbi:thrombospondin-type laminin G domain and EAR repeat-containing protein-like [Styela clava]
MLCFISMLSIFLSVSSAYPRICSDAKPVDILGEALTEKSSLPIGVEVVKADGVKGYRFNSDSVTFGVNSEKVFKRCPSLPTEFSIQINYRHPVPRNTYEYMLTLLAPDRSTILFAVRLRNNSLLLEFVQDIDHSVQTVQFKNIQLTDGEWHNLVISVTEREIKFTLDCEEYTRIIDQPIATDLNIRKTRFYIGSRRQKRNRFTGTLRQIIFLPGADATNLICPSPNPSLATVQQNLKADLRSGSHVVPVIFQEEQPYITCSRRHKGRLLYTSDSTLKVCDGEDFADIKSSPLRMDYLVDYEDIPTNSSIDIEAFDIPDEGHFLATANRGGEKDSKSAIYKWDGVKYVIFQKVSTKNAQHWKYFSIGDEHFLALANSGYRGKNNVKSIIFRWKQKKRKFVRHQLILTYSARRWETFEIDGQHYIAVANHEDDANNIYNLSEIFIWNPDGRMFLPYQNIPSVGAVDIEFFRIELSQTFNFIVVANAFNGQTSNINSSIFFWQRGKFQFFQDIETMGASDWEFFEIDGRFYLAVANTFDLDTRVSGERNYRISSPIYELNIYLQRFEKIQDVITFGARDWEFFTVGDNSYLIVSSIATLDNKPVSNVIYKWQGVEKFVPVHNFTSRPSTDFEHVAIAGQQYLAMAQPFLFFSKLFKIVTY